MKKVLSVVLAALLLCAACVPAFAANLTLDKATPSQTIEVTTSDWEDAASYTVTIPATVEIPWEGTPAENGGDSFEWSYDCQLLVGQHLEVYLDKTAGAMTNADTTDTLPYTLSTDGANVPLADSPFCSAGAVETGTQKVDIGFAEGAWKIAIGEYTDTLTFNVAVSDEAHA